MKQKHIGFRDLLERLLPVEELPPLDRLQVQRALRSGVALEVERAAMRTLELLEQQGAVRRLPATHHESVVRFQARDQHDVITLHVPGPRARQGVIVVPRTSLPTQAPARLDQVRRLLRLDDPMIFSDPRSGTTRAGLVAQLDQAGRELLGAATVRFFGVADELDERSEDPLDPELASEALEHPGTILYATDLARTPEIARGALSRGVRALVVIAVTSADGKTVGHLEVRTAEPEPFSSADFALIALLADFCGGVLERASRIEQLVFVDPLTTVYNRSYYELQIRNEIARARRDQASLALLLCDIDDFKSFNTAYGYEAGNQVLVQVAQSLRSTVRPFDTVARWGGEEFAVLLTSPVGESDVVAISERLRGTVERTSIRLEGLDGRAHRVNVTISVGVAMFPEHADNTQELWRVANLALQQAKRPPKNRVEFYRPPGDTRFGLSGSA